MEMYLLVVFLERLSRDGFWKLERPLVMGRYIFVAIHWRAILRH